jgi:dienelactone hydrolase
MSDALKPDTRESRCDRRSLLKAAALGAVSVGTLGFNGEALLGGEVAMAADAITDIPDAQVGTLFPLLRKTADRSLLELSFLHDRFRDVEAWKREARPRVRGLLQYDPPPCDARAEVLERVDCGEYVREQLAFNTTSDIRAPAYLLLPKGEKKRRPAVVALHDHGGFFVWGKEKVVATENEHPSLVEFKRRYYAGRSVADDLARRGYVVIAIDMFYWGERRMLLAADAEVWRDRARMSAADVQAFDRRSSGSTSLVATGLFEAGITWSGVMFLDDIRTVDYLASRPEVDPERIGCCGLSVGGFRSAHLAGLDARIKAAVVVGWMSTYGAMLPSHLTSIGPMKLVPGLYKLMDLPDVTAMTAPGGLMVINGTQDRLFPLEGVHAAFDKMAKVYAKVGVPERFQGVLYDGPHEFNAAMQDRAFAWLDRFLKP